MVKMNQIHYLTAGILIILLMGCGNFTTSLRETVSTEEMFHAESTSKATEEDSDIQTSEQTVTHIMEDISNQAMTKTDNLAEEPSDQEFVKVTDYIPDIVIDLKYASKDNFTGQVIYTFTDAYLRYGTVKKLQRVQSILTEEGMGLKLWDGFRPVSAQFTLWEVCPNPVYVADPNRGYSSHSRGNTVDITLVSADGTEIEMPSGFDDFSERADRNYSDCSAAVCINAGIDSCQFLG